MDKLDLNLPEGKKIYFASDFHLGAPSKMESRQREARIISWLNAISTDVGALFLVGDIFDFWFEYKHVIPKGFLRFQGKLAAMRDSGIPIYFFRGNHDMWMFDYFESELEIPVYSDPIHLKVNKLDIMVGHGDGLGPGDSFYKFLKKIFRNPISQWLFSLLHPTIGIGIANYWSSKSRLRNTSRDEEFEGDKEWLYQFAREVEKRTHFDYYIFGHRHLPLEMDVNASARYINLGEWVNHQTYAELDRKGIHLKKYGQD